MLLWRKLHHSQTQTQTQLYQVKACLNLQRKRGRKKFIRLLLYLCFGPAGVLLEMFLSFGGTTLIKLFIPKGTKLSFQTKSQKKYSAVCASSMYSCLCMKMSSFLFVRACAKPRMVYLSCGIPFPVIRHLLSFLVKHQLWSGCHGEKSSKKYQVTF